MNFSYSDLLQKPYYFKKKSFFLEEFVCANISYTKRLENYPFYFFETLMPEHACDYGNALIENGLNFGHGVSFKNPEEAMKKSIFEAFERKFAKVYDEKSLIYASYNEVKNKAVNPHVFSLPDKEEHKNKLPYVKYTHNLKLHWKECMQVVKGTLKPVLIPASLIYSRYSWKNQKERIAPTLSPGIAAHVNYRSSFLSGLLEIIERDAFMLAWLKKLSFPKISFSISDLESGADAFEHISALGFKTTFIDITSDVGIPVVLTIIKNPSLKLNGTMFFGLGCSLNPYQAVQKSFMEALQGMSNVISFDYQSNEVVVEEEKIKTKFDLSCEDYFQQTAFLSKSKKQTKIGQMPFFDKYDVGKNMDFLLKYLEEKNLPAYFVDLTPKEINNDVAVCLTRAFIGNLMPMVYDIDCFRLSNRRVYTAKDNTSKTVKDIKYQNLNLLPHPLAIM